MSELEVIREIVSTAGGGGVLITLFLLWKLGFFNGRKHENGIPSWAAELKEHYNDETTRLLEKIITLQEKHNDLEKDNQSMLIDIVRNGVPCREKK